MEANSLIRIATFSNPNEAQLLATQLQANGVPTYMPEDYNPIHLVSTVYPIAVRAEHVQQAIEIMHRPYMTLVR